jgi:hypothetical protein
MSSLPTLEPKRVISFAQKFIAGVSYGVPALLTVIRDQSIYAIYRRYLKWMIPSFLLVYSVLWILLIPVHLVLMLIDQIAPSMELSESVPTALALLYGVSTYVPIAVLICMRWTSMEMYEGAFFCAMRRINPELCKRLQAVNPQDWTTMLIKCVRRSMYLVTLGAGMSIASRIPYIGFLALPAAAAYAATCLTGCLECGILIGLFSFVPIVGGFAHHFLVCLRSSSREVLEPYLSRTDAQVSQLTRNKQHQKTKSILLEGTSYAVLQKLGRAEAAFVMGFAVPFTLLLAIPFIGPLFILIAQAAGAHLAIPLMCNRNSICISSPSK